MNTKRLMFLAFAVGIAPLIGSASPPPRLAESQHDEAKERAHGKRAWEWTAEERITRRLDPSSAAARRALAVADGRLSRDAPYDERVVLGKYNPELLLPWELMDHVFPVFNLADLERRDDYRAKWASRGASDLIGDDFWTRLQDVLRPIIEADAESGRLQIQMDAATGADREELEKQWSPVNDSLCPLRAKALSAARTTFGREKFDRFLYEVVAPDVVIRTSSSSSSVPVLVDTEQWVEGGCQ